MLVDIVDVKPLGDHKLYLWFEDEIEGEVDVAQLISFTGVFAALREVNYFQQVKVEPDLGTIAWTNDADFDPDVLYSIVTGEPLPQAQRT